MRTVLTGNTVIKMMQMLKLCSRGDECAHPEGPELALSDFYNDKSAKDGKQARCKSCFKAYAKKDKDRIAKYQNKYRDANSCEIKEYKAQYYAEHKDELLQKTQQWYRLNKGRSREYNQKYHMENRKEILGKQKRYRKENKDRLEQYRTDNREMLREASRVSKQTHKGAVNAYNAKARAAKLQRTVAWADLEAIKQVYRDCQEINIAAKLAGCTEKLVVDHIIPLQGTNVSGLHISSNLQIITDTENSKKNNHFDPVSFNA